MEDAVSAGPDLGPDPSLLLVDDDAPFLTRLAKAMEKRGFAVETAASVAEGQRIAATRPPAYAVVDLRLEDGTGLSVVERLREARPDCRIVVLTGHGSVEAAVEAMKLGAFSFLEKPVDAELLAPLLEQAIADGRRGRGPSSDLAPPIVGPSAAMEEVRRFVQQVGPTDATVAVFGETGTGKEVVARRIHLASPRAAQPFVARDQPTRVSSSHRQGSGSHRQS